MSAWCAAMSKKGKTLSKKLFLITRTLSLQRTNMFLRASLHTILLSRIVRFWKMAKVKSALLTSVRGAERAAHNMFIGVDGQLCA